jgi:hypothetical protein
MTIVDTMTRHLNCDEHIRSRPRRHRNTLAIEDDFRLYLTVARQEFTLQRERLVVLMAVFWMTEALPLTVTALPLATFLSEKLALALAPTRLRTSPLTMVHIITRSTVRIHCIRVMILILSSHRWRAAIG